MPQPVPSLARVPFRSSFLNNVRAQEICQERPAKLADGAAEIKVGGFTDASSPPFPPRSILRYPPPMNTQTHLIMGAALFGRRVPKYAWAGALGGVLPDIPMITIVAALKIAGINDFLIFGLLYWQNWWQITNAIAHNFWAWGGLLLISILMRERRSLSVRAIDGWTWVVIFASSGLLHSVIDFLVHRDDAHMSFWPLTRWKFMSPVSYWDPQHYGHYFGVFEALLGFGLAALLISRFHNRIVRALLALGMLGYALIPAYFILL